MSDSMTNLLDATLDDLEDLPTYAPYPAGVHRVLATFTEKEGKDKAQLIELSFKALNTEELVDPAKDTPIEAGDETSVSYMLDNEWGQKFFKKDALPFGEHFATRSLREIVEQTTDIECLIVTSLRQDKSDKTKFYMDVKEIHIV